MPEPPLAQLIVDLSANTGALRYSASGFLYGLGNAGIPSVNLLAPLKPQVAAQKPEGGLQHPNGDAFNVAETFQAAGGREIEIYIQDMYPDWPYTFRGLDDYLAIVERVVQQVVAQPNHDVFSYVPFNEPDNIWYNNSDKKQTLFDDWKTVHRKIKSLDAAARIVGPNFARYDSAVYREFLTFTRDNDCVPEVISWHELNDSFFAEWYSRYDDFRRSERALGISPREICINEYARQIGDLGVPGKLVQWITRIENSKVDGCLAYWTTAGCLNDLAVRDSNNQATGGWWLYKWYAGLIGHAVQVAPPDANAEGLQGLACFDEDKTQARIVFGGCNGSVQVVVNGLRSDFFGDNARVVVWGIKASGTAPSNGPDCVMQTSYPIVNGRIIVTVNDMLETNGYQMIVTPNVQAGDFPGQANFVDPDFYFAEYADTSGDAVTFVVTAQDNGFYNMRIRLNAQPQKSSFRIVLNSESLREFSIQADDEATKITLFLTRGINRVTFTRLEDECGTPNIHSIKLSPSSGAMQGYPASAKENTLSGNAVIVNDPASPSGSYGGGIGNGTDNSLQFNNITVPSYGTYHMVVHYANAEFHGEHDYNTNVVDRFANIRVNGHDATRVYFRNTFAWNVYRTKVVDVTLDVGANSIEFSNDTADAPHVAKIEIATRFTELDADLRR